MSEAEASPETRLVLVLRHADVDERTHQIEASSLVAIMHLATELARRTSEPAVILCSEKTRTRVTARALAKQLGQNPDDVTAVPWLVPDRNTPGFRSGFAQALRDLQPEAALVLVTHLPQVSAIAGLRDPGYAEGRFLHQPLLNGV